MQRLIHAHILSRRATTAPPASVPRCSRPSRQRHISLQSLSQTRLRRHPARSPTAPLVHPTPSTLIFILYKSCRLARCRVMPMWPVRSSCRVLCSMFPGCRRDECQHLLSASSSAILSALTVMPYPMSPCRMLCAPLSSLPLSIPHFVPRSLFSLLPPSLVSDASRALSPPRPVLCVVPLGLASRLSRLGLAAVSLSVSAFALIHTSSKTRFSGF